VGAPGARLRVGVLRHVPSGASTLHPDCVAAVDGAGKAFESLGHAVEEAHPGALAETEPTSTHFLTLVTSWVATALADWGEKLGRSIGPDDVEPITWAFAEEGRAVSASRYVRAVMEFQAYSRRMARWWADGFDLLVTPTLGEPPPRIGSLATPRDNPLEGVARTIGLIPFTPPFNITGQPAMSLPLHWNRDGLPIGVQLVAAYGREDLLIRAAAQLEQAKPWKDRRPPIHG
jgi:amidase